MVTPQAIAFVVDGRVRAGSPSTAGSITFGDTDLVNVGGVFNDDGTINDPFPMPFDDINIATW